MAGIRSRSSEDLILWNREDVAYCNCSDMESIHTHCPCRECKGKAVYRGTEHRHWKLAQALIGAAVALETPHNGSTIINSSHLEETELPEASAVALSRSSDTTFANASSSSSVTSSSLQLDAAIDHSTTVTLQDEPVMDFDDSTDGHGDRHAASYRSSESTVGDRDANSNPLHVLEAVLKAMKITDDVGGSQANFLSILEFGKEMYYKNHEMQPDENVWPRSWQAALRMLERSGYNEPQDLYICLDSSHPCSFDVIKSQEGSCKYCAKKGSDGIKYSYLPLRNKISQWCQDASFCVKMTAHWQEKDHWISSGMISSGGRKELWDGERFAELALFWDPQCNWVLPTRCPLCSQVVSSALINGTIGSVVSLICPECHKKFQHRVQSANGDPRNIALIGHWDGWLPFSGSVKHTSGQYFVV